MMDWDWFDQYFPRSRPITAKGGIKSKSQRGGFGSTWWAKRWIEVLEGFNLGARLTRGRSYARSGQVLSVDVSKGSIRAKVQGSRPRPYEIDVQLKPLSSADWKRVAEGVSAQAKYASKLLAGEMPAEIESIFNDVKTPLFPERHGDLKTECSCPDWSNPCKHIAAVYYLLAEELDRDPFLMFRLRGIERDEFFGLLGDHSAPQETHQPAPEPLPHSRSAFWPELEIPADLVAMSVADTDIAALPRRLGQFPFWRGSTPLLESLDRTYATAGRVARDWMEGSYARLPGAPAPEKPRPRAKKTSPRAKPVLAEPATEISADLLATILGVWPGEHTYTVDMGFDDEDEELPSWFAGVEPKLSRELRKRIPFVESFAARERGRDEVYYDEYDDDYFDEDEWDNAVDAEPPYSYHLYFLGPRATLTKSMTGWLIAVSELAPVAAFLKWRLERENHGGIERPYLIREVMSDAPASGELAKLLDVAARLLKKYRIRILTEAEAKLVVPGLKSSFGEEVTVFDAFFFQSVDW